MELEHWHTHDLCDPIWVPERVRADGSAIVRFARWASATGRADLTDPFDYAALWRWSVQDIETFWHAVLDFFLVADHHAGDPVLVGDRMETTRWFPASSLNFAGQLLGAGEDENAVCAVWVQEDGRCETTTWRELRDEVGALARTLCERGVGLGDRVIGFVPHARYALVGFLATASLGAVWSQCAPDYGARAAIDRFAQLEPKALIAVDGYLFNGRRYDRRGEVQRLCAGLPTLKNVVFADYGGHGQPELNGIDVLTWQQATTLAGEFPAVEVPFNHPLWVLFTSGTTGVPKGIVHGHGGMALEQRVFSQLHMDVGSDDVYLWHTTPNWAVWNLHVASLLGGGQIVAYDGSPVYPDVSRLWQLASDHGVTVLGTSPGYLMACEKADLRPAENGDLSIMRTLGSTGATLPPGSYRWVRDRIGPHVQVASVSGGTDVAGAFLASAPTTPIWPGEISAPALGVALESFDEAGRPVTDEVGELVVTQPLPAMPLGIWGDHGGERYHDSYFDTFDGVWRHGDWITITSRGTTVMHGRSDATLNRNGVRLGSADIYEIVERLPEITEALVVGVDRPDGGYWMPLFVVLSPCVRLDEVLREKLRSALRTNASPRHVPDEIIAVPRLPHTRTGKKLEVPIKRILQGAAPETVASLGAVDDAAALEFFLGLAQRH